MGSVFPLSKNSTEPAGSTGPGRCRRCNVALKVVLWPTSTGGGTSRETEVESGLTVRVMAPVDPGAVDPEFGVNTAVTRSGDVDAANDVWQVAAEFDGVIRSPTQSAIGAPRLLNVIVPDGASSRADLREQRHAFVRDEREWEATSEVLLGPAAWTRVAAPVRRDRHRSR